jgi:DNA-binding GntR family transcriptional regulator
MGYDYAPPKYAQVYLEIRRRIEHGEYSPGTLLPSEHQLVEEFGVSRPTIVRALLTLRQEGWIETQQGKGSFVRGRPALVDAERTRPAHGVLELPEAQLAGQLVQAGVKLAPPHVTALLGLQAGARAFVRQRLLTEDGEPVELASAWLPLELAAGTDLASPDLLNESIRQHLQTRRKIRFDHAVEQITAPAPGRGGSRPAACRAGRPGAQRDRHRLRRGRAAHPGQRPGTARAAARAAGRLPLHLGQRHILS